MPSKQTSLKPAKVAKAKSLSAMLLELANDTDPLMAEWARKLAAGDASEKSQSPAASRSAEAAQEGGRPSRRRPRPEAAQAKAG